MASRNPRKVLQLILDLRDRGIPVILISHNMPHVFEVADRTTSTGWVIASPSSPRTIPHAEDAVAIMTGAADPDYQQALNEVKREKV